MSAEPPNIPIEPPSVPPPPPQTNQSSRLPPVPELVQQKPRRICVVNSDYKGSKAAHASVDDYECSPAHFIKNDPLLSFEHISLQKKDAFFELRKAINKKDPENPRRRYYDCFFVLADGAMDEDRAGVEVPTVLERFSAPFTGARSAFYELTKPEMKVLAMRNGIETSKFAVLEDQNDIDNIEDLCSHLEFPLIVKHASGYGSVGMSKNNKCKDLEHLIQVCQKFISEYECDVLVEEFVSGMEVTCLACGDSSQPDGVRVYPPVYVTFPEGEDFKHFDLKFADAAGMVWMPLPREHPAYDEIIRTTRVAFQTMMAGVGYGRTDLRIDEKTNKVVFLEINPNCGIMYPVPENFRLSDLGSADVILMLSDPVPLKGHADFIKLQINEALLYRDSKMPMFKMRLDGTREGGWSTRASRFIPSGTVVLMMSSPSTRQEDVIKQVEHLETNSSEVVEVNADVAPAVTTKTDSGDVNNSNNTNNNNNNLKVSPVISTNISRPLTPSLTPHGSPVLPKPPLSGGGVGISSLGGASASSACSTPVSFVMSASGGIVSGNPFPKANPQRKKELNTTISRSAQAKHQNDKKDQMEAPNVVFKEDVNCYVAIRDILEGEEILI